MRKKTTVYIEEDLLKAAKIVAARTGKRDYQVFEEALRQHLGAGVAEKVWRRSRLSADQALRLAYKELNAERDRAKVSGRIVRLGGLWKGTRPISEQDIRKLRSEIWRRLS